MKKSLASALSSYREFRAAKARNRPYRVIRNPVVSLVAAYLLTCKLAGLEPSLWG
ncbi:MAG: hypothetical protein H0U18_01115 [Pyrinomonadaceae bacterium]|nr:hypothetical protein [Pyrinomonadaceae bacterium]